MNDKRRTLKLEELNGGNIECEQLLSVESLGSCQHTTTMAV